MHYAGKSLTNYEFEWENMENDCNLKNQKMANFFNPWENRQNVIFAS